MQPYSVSDAVFFATSHDKPSRHFRRLAVIYVLSKALIFLVFGLLTLPITIPLFELIASGIAKEDIQSELITKISLLANIEPLSGILFLPLFLAIMASFYRWSLNDDWSNKRFGLRFGTTELHLFLVYLAVYIIIILAALVLLIPFVIAGVALGYSGAEFTGYQFFMFFFGGLVYLAILIWLSVKLSLAAALTVRHGDIKVFESFAATKGHFWKLFASHLFFFLILIVISLVLLVVIFLIAAPFLGIGYAMFGFDINPDDYGKVAALAAIPLTLIIILSLVFEFWTYVANAGIAVYFLRWKEGKLDLSVEQPVMKKPSAPQSASKPALAKQPPKEPQPTKRPKE